MSVSKKHQQRKPFLSALNAKTLVSASRVNKGINETFSVGEFYCANFMLNAKVHFSMLACVQEKKLLFK